MSDELPLMPVGEQSPETQISQEDIAEVQRLMARSVELAEEAMEKIRTMTGPKPGKMAQDMITSINQGAGFLRVCRDSIEGMFRKWKRCRVQSVCPHDHGFNAGPRDGYTCKRCDLHFTRQGNGTLVPTEIQL